MVVKPVIGEVNPRRGVFKLFVFTSHPQGSLLFTSEFRRGTLDCWSFEEKTFVKQSIISEWEKVAQIVRFTHYAMLWGGGGKA